MRVPRLWFLRRVRFTLRTLMFAVMVAGLFVGVETLRRRRGLLIQKAEFHRVEEDAWLRGVADLRIDEEDARRKLSSPWMVIDESTVSMDLRHRVAQDIRDRAAMKARAEWHGLMASKYGRAASRPWLSVATDTPEPPISRSNTFRVEALRMLDQELDRLMGRIGRSRLPADPSE